MWLTLRQVPVPPHHASPHCLTSFCLPKLPDCGIDGIPCQPFCTCTLLPFCSLGSDLQTYDKFLSKTHPLSMDFILQVSEMRKDPEPLIQRRPCMAFWYPNSWRKVYLRQECKAHELHRLHISPFHWGQNYGLKRKCGPYNDSKGIKICQRCTGEKSENSHYQLE